MGFGTLFIGYFLLLNLTYSGFTDVIAAAVMLLGLYKLSSVNRQFKIAAISTAVFLAFSLCELGISAYELFMGSIGSAALVSLLSIVRCWIIASLTFFMLKGIEEVAKEVDVEGLPQKASRLSIFTAVIYSAWIILEAPLSFINDYVLAVLSLFTILATIALIIANLTVIYSAYMRICMPGDEDLKDKPSRFAFVNEYRSRKEERDKEEAEKRIKEMKARLEKRKGQKK
jgi:hypothetical protein